MRKTAILLALACAFARADYGPGTTDSDLLRSGTPVVTNAWLAVSNETVRIARSVAGDAGAITDGTNRIDATRDVWRMYSGRVCTNASEVWTYSVGGATYTAEQMADAVGGGDSGYSQILVWQNAEFYGKDGAEEYEGWFVVNGSGTAPLGYSYTTGNTPESSANHFLALAEYIGFDYAGGTNVSITAFRGTFESGTNYVGRLALTNDIPDVTPPDFTTNNAQLVATIEATAPAPGNYSAVSNAAMNARSITELGVRGAPQGEGTWFTVNGERLDYNDGVWGERSSWRFIDMLGETYYFTPNESGSGMEFSLDQDYKAIVDGNVIIGYTNALAQVSQIPVISSSDPTFSNAVLSVGLNIDTNTVAAINALVEQGDELPIGGATTVGALLLALIAGLAALKRRVTSAETALAQKADVSDLPYALVEPGKWEFSGLSEDAAGAEMWYYDGDWTLYIEYDGETDSKTAQGSENDLVVVFQDASITATRASLPGHLLDRAGNRVVVSGDTTLTLPAANPGYLRDFLVRLEISGSTVPTITFAAPTGETITYETDGDEFPVPDEAGTWLYSFTETAAHKFAVALKKVNTVAQGGA